MKNKDYTELQLLVSGIEKLDQLHTANIVLCGSLTEWREGKKDYFKPYFPVEYRRSCQQGTHFEADFSCDLFMFAVKYYFMITGTYPPVNFQLNKKWKKTFGPCGDGWSEEMQRAFADIFFRCTRKNSNKRMQSAGEIMELESYAVLKQENSRLYGEDNKDSSEENKVTEKVQGMLLDWKTVFQFE